MDDLTLYLSVLAAIGFGGLALIVFIIMRGNANRASQRRDAPLAMTVPRVQVVLAEPDEGLIWVVNGRATRDMAAITDPADRRAVEELLERLRTAYFADAPAPVAPPRAAVVVPPTTPATVAPVASPPTPAAPTPTPTSATVAAEATDDSPAPARAPEEDDFNRPFFNRLRDSVFGVKYDEGTPLPSREIPAPRKAPKGNKSPVPVVGNSDPDIGIPHFDELNRLLQLQLAKLPDAPPTIIRAGRQGMLEILVEGRIYDHIDDVPHDEVRAAMRAAVELWNQQG